MDENVAPAERAGVDGAAIVARIERFFLSALRIALLVIATVVVVYALWLAVSGAYQISRDVSSVREDPVAISATDITVSPTPFADRPASVQRYANTGTAAYYRQFVDRYYAIYARDFAPFRQKSDRAIDRKSFDARYVRSTDRLASIATDDLDFGQDRVSLERLLVTMQQAAALPETKTRLEAYRRAVRTKVSRTVSDSRTERYCSYYSEYFEQCITYDTRDVPFKRTVTETRLPKGVVDPPELFQNYQDKFFELLSSRTQDSMRKAAQERDDIVSGNAAGASALARALQWGGGFLLIMFLFLLIAIERHQRRMSQDRSAPE